MVVYPVLPFQQWLVTVILIIRQRDKAQKKIQDYLEKELDARTSVVMKQKGRN